MSEKDMRKMIRWSAQNVEIPESLEPEKVKNRLQSAGRRNKRTKNHRHFYFGYGISAAAFLLVCGLTFGRGFSGNDQEKLFTEENDFGRSQREDSVEGYAFVEETEENTEKWRATLAQAAKPKKDAGEIYLVAADYDEVYDAVIKTRWDYKYSVSDDGLVFVEEMAEETMIQDGAQAPGEAAASESNVVSGVTKSKEYSETNVQTMGVDESDIIKTDGEFLYIVSNNQIYILDIRQGEAQKTGVLNISSDNTSLDVVEIYVDGNTMIVITQERSTKLLELSKDNEYYTDSQDQTVCYTYSVEDPAEPRLLGKVSQDGYYYTSRKIDDKLYLFTNEGIGELCYRLDRHDEGWIPMVNGEKITCDCIYIPQQGSNSLIISSVDMAHPDQALDTVMIVNNGAQVYVSTNAVYLYHTEYDNTVMTEIAKFRIEDGVINAHSAASVKGRVTDTFAIHEKEGMLRVLTNEVSSGEGSSLFILDENLKKLGELGGIAPGEDVYAARYLGDMVYFITYRNIDPLFAVNLSDPASPVILGELKITGYSEYLHMWKDGTMVGIGYETDPDKGTREGVKLSMFDVSDPCDLKVKDSICITDADYSPAMGCYKTVLVDPAANLIGFVVTEYDRRTTDTYLLFEYKDGVFSNLLTEEVEEPARNYRGIYVGEYFYIVSSSKVRTYDRENAYKSLAELKLLGE